MSSTYEYALEYAKLKWHIFPLAPGKKTPITSNGVKDATVDAAIIRAWWEKWPDANVALACGKESGVWVVDIDVNKEKGINGFASLGRLPGNIFVHRTLQQLTPRGGLHLLFTTANPPRNKNSFLTGVDIRGEGYYIVLAPSRLDPYDGCLNGGVYSWADGLDPWHPGLHLAQFPDCMRPAERDAAFKGVSIVRRETLAPPPSLDILQRASKYLATVDPAVQGSGGHGKLFWAAQCMVSGCKLSDEQAFTLLAGEYNPRCSPPWNLGNPSELKDFRRKITEARRCPPSHKPIGWIVDAEIIDSANITTTVDLDSLLSAVREKQDEAARPQTIEEKASEEREIGFLTKPTGLLGEICSWINSGAFRPQPILTLACTLTWLGVLYGRRVKDERGGRTNIYCMGVARSSSGKDHAPRQIRRLAFACGGIGLIGGNDIASDTAIEERMSKAPSTLFLLDEIGHLLASIKSGQDKNKSGILSVLMRLYSCASDVYIGKEYADTEKQRIIVEPCCCLYGTSTPERFTEGITPGEIQDGWLGRCLVFNADRFLPKTDVKELDVPQTLIDQCAAWLNVGKEGTDGASISKYLTACGNGKYTPNADPIEAVVVKTTIDAEREFGKLNSFAESIDYIDQTATLWLKAEENARRIALIMSASDSPGSPVIDGRTADYACRLIRYVIKEFCRVIIPEVVSSKVQHDKRSIFKSIASSGKEGLTKGEITRKSQWTSQPQRDGMLADLMAAGEIACVAEGKAFRFWAAEWFLKRGAAKDV